MNKWSIYAMMILLVASLALAGCAKDNESELEKASETESAVTADTTEDTAAESTEVSAESYGTWKGDLKEPETLKERFSYAFGFLFSQSYAQQGIELSPEYFAQAMKEAIAGESGYYSQEELNAILAEYQNLLMEQQKAEREKVAAANLEEAETFLATNKTREGVIETESGLQYEIVVEGDGPKPTADDVVTVQYKGSFINGTVFESSYDSGKPATFAVNAIIPGWVEGIQLMPVGSKYRFFLHPDLAYGEMGSDPVIGPNQLLIFEIELLSIDTEDKPAE